MNYLDRCITYRGGQDVIVDLDKLANNSRAREEWEEFKLPKQKNKGCVCFAINVFPLIVQKQIALTYMSDGEKNYVPMCRLQGTYVFIDLEAVRKDKSALETLVATIGELPPRVSTLVPLSNFNGFVQRYLLACS